MSALPPKADIGTEPLNVRYVPKADIGDRNKMSAYSITLSAILIVTIMVSYVGLVYGPIGAFLAEYFPGRIRYTSVSVPYHIGNGWGGGLVPFVTTARLTPPLTALATS